MTQDSQSPMTLESVIGDFRYTESVFALTGTPQVIAKPSPSRCFLGIYNSGAGSQSNVSSRSAVSTADGIFLSGSGGNVEFHSHTAPAIVAAAWYGVGGLGGQVTVIEVFYVPRG